MMRFSVIFATSNTENDPAPKLIPSALKSGINNGAWSGQHKTKGRRGYFPENEGMTGLSPVAPKMLRTPERKVDLNRPKDSQTDSIYYL